VGLRSQQTYHEALCVVVPDPRRIVVVAVDVGEARRSESQKGLDEALRAEAPALRRSLWRWGGGLWQA